MDPQQAIERDQAFENFLQEDYRLKVDYLKVFTPVGEMDDVPAVPGREPKPRRARRYRSPVEWHARSASTTMLPAEFALAVVGLWIATIVLFT